MLIAIGFSTREIKWHIVSEYVVCVYSIHWKNICHSRWDSFTVTVHLNAVAYNPATRTTTIRRRLQSNYATSMWTLKKHNAIHNFNRWVVSVDCNEFLSFDVHLLCVRSRDVHEKEVVPMITGWGLLFHFGLLRI